MNEKGENVKVIEKVALEIMQAKSEEEVSAVVDTFAYLFLAMV